MNVWSKYIEYKITDILPRPRASCKISPRGVRMILRTVIKQPRTTWGVGAGQWPEESLELSSGLFTHKQIMVMLALKSTPYFFSSWLNCIFIQHQKQIDSFSRSQNGINNAILVFMLFVLKPQDRYVSFLQTKVNYWQLGERHFSLIYKGKHDSVMMTVKSALWPLIVC